MWSYLYRTLNQMLYFSAYIILSLDTMQICFTISWNSFTHTLWEGDPSSVVTSICTLGMNFSSLYDLIQNGTWYKTMVKVNWDTFRNVFMIILKSRQNTFGIMSSLMNIWWYPEQVSFIKDVSILVLSWTSYCNSFHFFGEHFTEEVCINEIIIRSHRIMSKYLL